MMINDNTPITQYQMLPHRHLIVMVNPPIPRSMITVANTFLSIKPLLPVDLVPDSTILLQEGNTAQAEINGPYQSYQPAPVYLERLPAGNQGSGCHPDTLPVRCGALAVIRVPAALP
jgi:hypothetical protein